MTRAPVVAPRWDDEANAARGVVDVARKPWDQVQMEVHDGLAGGSADVHADVVAVRAAIVIQPFLDFVDQGHQRFALCGRDFEPGCDVAARDDERVSGGDGIGIAEGHGQGIPRNDRAGGWITERATRQHFGHMCGNDSTRRRCVTPVKREGHLRNIRRIGALTEKCYQGRPWAPAAPKARTGGGRPDPRRRHSLRGRRAPRSSRLAVATVELSCCPP